MTHNKSFAEETAIVRKLSDDPKVKILAVLTTESRGKNITDIADETGMSRSTVYDHLEQLMDVMGAVEKGRKIGGSQLYEINRDNDVATDFARLAQSVADQMAKASEKGGVYECGLCRVDARFDHLKQEYRCPDCGEVVA